MDSSKARKTPAPIRLTLVFNGRQGMQRRQPIQYEIHSLGCQTGGRMARRRKISSSNDKFLDGWTLSIPIASKIPEVGWQFTGVPAGIASPIYPGSPSLPPKDIPGTLEYIDTPPSTVNSSTRLAAYSRVNVQLRHGTSSDPIPAAKPAASRSASGFSIPKVAERFAPAIWIPAGESITAARIKWQRRF